MNPAALKANLKDLKLGGIIIANADAFRENDLAKAGYTANPLEDGSLERYRVYPVQITKLTRAALAETQLPQRVQDRCKNFFALGMIYYLYHRPLDVSMRWIEEKFAKSPDLAEANTLALKGGYAYCEATEIFPVSYEVPAAKLHPGTYRNISGNQALALGFVAAAGRAGRPLLLGSYPITLAGSDAMKQRVLPHVASGKCIAAFAVTEPQAGSDAAGIQTVAVRQGNSYVLNGSKRFISNAGIADFYVVFAKTNPSQGTAADVAACIAAVDTLTASDSLVKQLWENTTFFQEKMRQIGFNLGHTKTPITPVMIGDVKIARDFSQRLFEEGIFAQAIGYPTVPTDKARIRVMISAAHSRDDLVWATERFEKIGKSLGILQ